MLDKKLCPSLSVNLPDNWVRCLACAHGCRIAPGGVGQCGVRKNIDGKLELGVYGHPVDVALDPIEKKPLYHFLPGSKVLSLGTYGCNLRCDFCQNWKISQASKTTHIDSLINDDFLTPQEVVDYAVKTKVPSIAYTYNEPTVFFEYAYDIGVLAREQGINNVLVSNGYFSSETLSLLPDFVDAVNIDLKSFDENFYQLTCGGSLDIVLKNIRQLHQMGIWIELTTLVITDYNDQLDQLKEIAKFIASVDVDIPWHISRFSPAYKMGHVPTTGFEKINQAAMVGRSVGLNFVYGGNLGYGEKTETVCPHCDRVVVSRNLFTVNSLSLDSKGNCQFCGKVVPGVWG